MSDARPTLTTRADFERMLLEMLGRQPNLPAARAVSDLALAQARLLEDRAPVVVEEARAAGVEIEHLGQRPLFLAPRLYRAEPNDWIIGPVTRREDLVVPKAEQQTLRRLAAPDLDFEIYVAHEVPKDRTAAIDADSAHVPLPAAAAAALVGPVPDPHRSVALGDRLERRTRQIGRGLRRTAVTGGALAAGIAAAPVLLAGAAVAGLAELDPIILGAVPVGEPRDGEMAAWFVLARWDW